MVKNNFSSWLGFVSLNDSENVFRTVLEDVFWLELDHLGVDCLFTGSLKELDSYLV